MPKLRSPNKNSGYQSPGGLAWLAKVLIHIDVGRVMPWHHNWRTLGGFYLEFSWTSPYVLLSLADFKLYPSPIICTPSINIASFSEFCESQKIIKPESIMGALWTCRWYQRWGWYCSGLWPQPLQFGSLWASSKASNKISYQVYKFSWDLKLLFSIIS